MQDNTNTTQNTFKGHELMALAKELRERARHQREHTADLKKADVLDEAAGYLESAAARYLGLTAAAAPTPVEQAMQSAVDFGHQIATSARGVVSSVAKKLM